MKSNDLDTSYKKTTMDTIRDINQVALFVGLLLLGFILGAKVLSELFYTSRAVDGVAVLPEDKPGNPRLSSSRKYSQHFLAKLKDTFVFNLSSETIDPGYRHSNALQRSTAVQEQRRGLYHATGAGVNLIFVGPGGDGIVLFEKDVLVNSYEFYRQGTMDPHGGKQNHLDRNLYLVTTSDTNQDGFLNYGDKQTLYVSEYNGAGLKVVSEDVESYREIGANTFLVTTFRGKEKAFFEYHIVGDELNELRLPKL